MNTDTIKAKAMEVEVSGVAVEFVAGDLVEQNVPALMLSANNLLETNPQHWSWSLEVERRAGPSYQAECGRLVGAAGPDGLPQGTATVTGGGQLAAGGMRRWVLQAITIGYHDGRRSPATPAIVYGAVRSALERAEVFGIEAVATYLLATRPGYATAPPDEMIASLFHALADHAAVSSSVRRIVICDPDADRLARAAGALRRLYAQA